MISNLAARFARQRTSGMVVLGMVATLVSSLASPAMAGADAEVPEPGAVSVVGARFEVTTAEGRILAQAELVGAVLTIGQGGQHMLLRIDAVETDPRNPDGAVMLYSMSSRDPVSGTWQNICEADAENRRMGFPLAGTWTADGRHLPSDRAFSITCTGGAQGKCVRFGYRPWVTLTDGTSLWQYHQACTRMIRADYCGDGVGHTRNGTPVVIYDRLGIQKDEPAPEMSFEAAWGPDGALCVSHTRIPDILTTEQLSQMCPEVEQRLSAGRCEASEDAFVFNESASRISADDTSGR